MSLNLDLVKQHLEQGKQYQEAGQFEAAIASYQQALTLDPASADLHTQLAELYYRQGKLAEVVVACHQALRCQPTFAAAYKTLGNALQAQGKLEPAIRAYAKALEVNPHFAPAYVNLGSMFYKQGNLDEAITYYKKAITIEPNLAAAYWNLGKVLEEAGQIHEAKIYQQKALEIQPSLAGNDFYFNQGNHFLTEGQLTEAIVCYQKSIALNPKNALAYCQLASAFLQNQNIEKALETYQKAIELEPTFAEAHSNLGTALVRQGKQQGELRPEQVHQAMASFQKALELKPNLMEAHRGWFEMLTTSRPEKINWLKEALETYRQVAGETGKILAGVASVSLHLQAGWSQQAKDQFFDLEKRIYQHFNELTATEIEVLYSHLLFNVAHLRDDLTANSTLFRFIAKQYVERCVNDASENPEEHPQNSPQTSQQRSTSPAKNDRLKIGVISNHFYRHSVGWCSFDIIRELSTLTPHIYLYVTGQMPADDLTERFKTLAEKFYPPHSSANGLASSPKIIEQIQKDEVDILIDLDSLTVPIHAQILHHKPAPICLSWLSFEAPFISANNYVLGDWQTHPEGTEHYYCEKLMRAPTTTVAVSGFETFTIDRIALRKANRIGLEQILYLCVAPGRKLNPETIQAQVKILKKVPDSVLFYKGKAEPAVIQSAYQQACQTQGVSFHRIKFLAPSQTEEEQRIMYLLADILLDSYPYNGVIHTLEALWFNLPIITRMGEQSFTRMSSSFLKSLEIQAGIAQNWQEYVEWGVRLGQDSHLRNSIKQHLANTKQPDRLAPLWNPKKLALDMYTTFQKLLWQKQGLNYSTDIDVLI